MNNKYKGIALIVTLFISIIIFMLITGLLLYARREYQISGGQLSSVKARYVSDAGIEYLCAEIYKKMADDPAKFKIYYYPASNPVLYDPNNLSGSATTVPATSPYAQPAWWPNTASAPPGIWLCRNTLYANNPAANNDDPEWRWVFRYTDNLTSPYDYSFGLVGGTTGSAVMDINQLFSAPVPFIDNRPNMWWQEQPYVITSAGAVKSGDITAAQRNYIADVRLFGERNAKTWYYKINY